MNYPVSRDMKRHSVTMHLTFLWASQHLFVFAKACTLESKTKRFPKTDITESTCRPDPSTACLRAQVRVVTLPTDEGHPDTAEVVQRISQDYCSIQVQ